MVPGPVFSMVRSPGQTTWVCAELWLLAVFGSRDVPLTVALLMMFDPHAATLGTVKATETIFTWPGWSDGMVQLTAPPESVQSGLLLPAW